MPFVATCSVTSLCGLLLVHSQATYDAATQEFVINTPNNEASKYWIGGSGQHGKICAVFAQLTVAGVWQVGWWSSQSSNAVQMLGLCCCAHCFEDCTRTLLQSS